ncbi:FAR-17a/AIG1-like protein [Syncephalis fuscata]|nr:FAR-17a/AIG1-like protein [Syncephalis fuscata]
MTAQLRQIAFHGLGLALLTFPYNEMRKIDTQVSMGFGGRLTYLTIVGLTVVWLTFALSLLNDILNNKVLTFIKRALMIIGFPLQAVITTFYWGLCLADPNLLKHPGDPVLGIFFDCSVHLFPCLLVYTELYVYNPSFKYNYRHLLSLLLFVPAYGTWLQLCFYMNGFWVYPFLGQLGHLQRLAFYFISAIIASGFYLLTVYAHQKLHSHPLKVKAD